MTQLTIIGSTGSVGRNTLKVVEHLSDRFSVFGLSAHSSVELLAAQVAAFHPKVVALSNAASRDAFQLHCKRLGIRVPDVVIGEDGLRTIAAASEVHTVVSAAVGAAGLVPTHAAVAAGKTVALANKEAMVLAGELLSLVASRTGARLIPVDSEHSALDQCLRSGQRGEVRRLILTASGGPFRETPARRLEHVTPEEALNHPTWKMGKRITIDSATMMNKGLEVIEARWLFDIPQERIDIMVHPQSIVHSMVEFTDGSTIAQLGSADMRQPIQYALTWPDRLESCAPRLDWKDVSRLDFMAPDTEKFPCVGIAYRAIELGGTAPAVVNAADEIAVAAFLAGEIPFTGIPSLIQATLDASDSNSPAGSIEAILQADYWARAFARDWVKVASR
jgi:1-deoxy-D-xylulose-5-phosphate reductoisomerase